MRTRSGSDYAHDTTLNSPPSQSTMEMDALDVAITSLDVTGPLTTEHLVQLLRGLAKTISGKVDLLIAKKDSEIKALNTRVSELEEKCDELEQYSRRNIIRIRGIPEKTGEETDAVVRELAATKLGVNIDAHDIVRSHRVGRTGDDKATPRDVIASFTSHNTKSAIMRNGRKLKGSRIFINEDMTRIRGKIAWEARQLRRDGKLIDTWTRDGIIFVKKTENNVKSFTAVNAWKVFKEQL